MPKKKLTQPEIEKQSRRLATMFTWVFWITTLWLFGDVSYVPLKRVGAALVTPEKDAFDQIIAFGDVMVGFLPVIFALVAVYTIRGLLVQFSRGEIFTTRNGASLSRAGDWLIASAAASLIVAPAVGYFYESEVENISADYIAIVFALVGLAIRLFGGTCALAADIKAENDQMV